MPRKLVCPRPVDEIGFVEFHVFWVEFVNKLRIERLPDLRHDEGWVAGRN
jgi:hypothetical protein